MTRLPTVPELLESLQELRQEERLRLDGQEATEEKKAWDSVAGWTVETGDDPFDDPAIWVWVILENMQEFEQIDKIRRRVLDTIDKPDDTRWVYVRFRTKEEQAELDEEKRQEAQEAPV